MYNKLVQELAVCSIKAVRALAEHHAGTIRRLFLRADRMEDFAPLCKQLAQQKRPYKICEDDELQKICATTHHQGIVAMITEPEVPPLNRDDLRVWAEEAQTGLILHDIGNEFNLGALVRQAAFFGVRYVVICELDKPPRLTTAAYRAAEGGMSHVILRSVRRTESFLREASSTLLIIGTDPRTRKRIRDFPDYLNEWTQRTGKRPGIALVLGGEEHGIPPQVKENCSILLRIPGTGTIESLNVAQAGALFCQEIFESC